MTNTQHTPGNWEIRGIDGDLKICAVGNSDALATVHCMYGVPDPEGEANARLIVAAPELLEALKLVEEASLAVNDFRRADLYLKAMPKVRATIAKATTGKE